MWILIFLMAVLQLGLYYTMGRRNFPFDRTFVFLSILAGHVFIFPRFFYQNPATNCEVHCGLPILGITFAFWIFGGMTTIIIHLICSVVCRKSYSGFEE